MLLSKNSQSFHIVSLESCGKLVKHLQMFPNAMEVLVGTLELLLPKLGKASLAPILLQELGHVLDQAVNLHCLGHIWEIFLDG